MRERKSRAPAIGCVASAMLVFAACTLAMSCAPASEDLEMPAVEGMQAVLVIIERLEPDAPPVVLRAIAVDATAPQGFADTEYLELPASGSEPSARISALYYAATLAMLGFPAGELAEAKPGQTGRRLPTFDVAYARELAGDAAEEWTSLTTLSRELQSYRLAVAP